MKKISELPNSIWRDARVLLIEMVSEHWLYQYLKRCLFHQTRFIIKKNYSVCLRISICL